MLRSRAGLIAATLGLAAVGTPCRSATADDARPYSGLAISVTKVDRRCFTDRVEVTGTLMPKREVQVRPDQEGFQVSQVLVEPGDTVVAGQVLARLTSPPGAQPQTIAVKSSVNGIASGVAAIVGAYASAGSQDPLFRIVTDGEFELRGEVQASALPQLKLDQAATLHVIGVGVMPGRVASISPAIDAKTQLGSARVSAGADPRLRTGIYARAEIDAGRSCALAVPLSAVLYGSDGAIVQVVRDDRVETRRVEVGLLDKDIVEIRDGLAEADVVVDHAGAFLREGDRVRPVPSTRPVAQ